MQNVVEMTDRTRLRRVRQRGRYDKETIHAILDAMPLCHVGYILDDAPVVMPTIQWREGDHLYWHASSGGRGIKASRNNDVCVTVSLLDGLVMARSGLHHSANFRSVMVFGKPVMIEDPAVKKQKLNNMIDSLYPGRSGMLSPIKDIEVKQTMVLSLPIDEASAKIRTGMPVDDEEDYGLPVWAGVVPISMTVGAPVPDPRNLPDVDMPDHIRNFTIG